jgi:hypothetical protein
LYHRGWEGQDESWMSQYSKSPFSTTGPRSRESGGVGGGKSRRITIHSHSQYIGVTFYPTAHCSLVFRILYRPVFLVFPMCATCTTYHIYLDWIFIAMLLILSNHIFSFPTYFISSPPRPEWLWGLPRFLFRGYRENNGRAVKLTIDLHLVPSLRRRGAMPPAPVRRYGEVLI